MFVTGNFESEEGLFVQVQVSAVGINLVENKCADWHLLN